MSVYIEVIVSRALWTHRLVGIGALVPQGDGGRSLRRALHDQVLDGRAARRGRGLAAQRHHDPRQDR